MVAAADRKRPRLESVQANTARFKVKLAPHDGYIARHGAALGISVAKMEIDANGSGLKSLIGSLKARAKRTAGHYRKEDTGITPEEWPRDAEVELIESLVREKARRVTGGDPSQQWKGCREFAQAIRDSRNPPVSREHFGTEEAQRRYERAEADFFDGIALWADSTMDYVTSLSGLAVETATKLRILFLAANPSDRTRLRLDRELRDIREELAMAGYRERFDLQTRGAVRAKDMVRALLELEPAYVHFSGHGTADGAICVEASDGTSHEIDPDALAALFAAAGEKVQCVLLNACFSENQALAIAPHVPFVIGMHTTISDEAAIAFATGFYRALGAGKGIPVAFELGIVELKLFGIAEHETPVIVQCP